MSDDGKDDTTNNQDGQQPGNVTNLDEARKAKASRGRTKVPKEDVRRATVSSPAANEGGVEDAVEDIATRIMRYDTFTGRLFKVGRIPTPMDHDDDAMEPREWTTSDTYRLLTWVQQKKGLPKAQLRHVEAALLLMESHPDIAFNAVLEAIEAHPWDGRLRLDRMTDFMDIDIAAGEETALAAATLRHAR